MESVDLSEGHRAIVRNAAKAFDGAVQARATFVECWSGLLGLFYDGIVGEYEPPTEEDPNYYAWRLRQAWFVGSLDTSKLAFDAATSGFYVQSLMLSRHLIEAWSDIRYSQLFPEQAHLWTNRDAQGHLKPPNDKTVFRALEKAEPEANRISVRRIHAAWTDLHSFAHPTRWMAQQAFGDDDQGPLGFVPVGGRYRDDMAHFALDRGTLATIILLLELRKHREQLESWHTELVRFNDLRSSTYALSDLKV